MLSSILIKYCSLFLNHIDKKRIRLSLESSPMYPTLLSVVQTLRYVGLDCHAGQCDWDYLKNLSAPFLLHLNFGKREHLIIAKWIQRKQCLKIYNLKFRRWIITKSNDIESIWDGVVIYSNNCIPKHSVFQLLNRALIVIVCIMIVVALYISDCTNRIIYYCPMILGLIISCYLYLRSEIIEENIIERLCHISEVADCEKVDKSKYSTICGIKMNCMALSFFLSQLLTMIVGKLLCLDNVLSSTYLISTIIIFPTIVYSAYGQYKIRNICPLCIIVVVSIAFEAITFLGYKQGSINIKSLILFCVIFIVVTFILHIIYNIRKTENEYLKERVKLLKIIRRNDIFCPKAFL